MYCKLSKINLNGATDVSGDVNARDGSTIQGKTQKHFSWKDIEAAGIIPVKKELVADVVTTRPNHYPHEKMEGIWLISNTIFVYYGIGLKF